MATAIFDIVTSGAEDTIAQGRRLAGLLRPGELIALTGDLGSGKTTFTKGIAAGMGVEQPEYVNSPSFVLIREYKGDINLYHLDLYRLDDLNDIEYMGIKDYLSGDGIVVMEWADKLKGLMPEEYLEVRIYITGENRRGFRFSAHGKEYADIIRRYIKQQI